MNNLPTGTSIQDLHRNEKIEQYDNIRRLNDMQSTQYGARQNMQYEQGHNAANHVQQGQHDQYYNNEDNYDYPTWLPKQKPNTHHAKSPHARSPHT